MSAKTIKINQLADVSRKQMAHQILVKRNKVGSIAKTSTSAAIAIWKGTAPVKTGAMRASVSKYQNVGISKVLVLDGKQLYKINSVNKYGRHKGFYDKFRRQTGNGFFNAVKSQV